MSSSDFWTNQLCENARKAPIKAICENVREWNMIQAMKIACFCSATFLQWLFSRRSVEDFRNFAIPLYQYFTKLSVSQQAEITLDMVSIAISLCDIISDLVLAKSYYDTGKMNFFYLSIFVLFVTQVCYTALFIGQISEHINAPWLNGSNDGLWTTVFIILAAFPFAQLAPLYVWAQNTYDNFNNDELNVESPMELFSLSNDPWNDHEFGKKMLKWAQKKTTAHIGFLLESVFEAFPQCIIQLSCILWYQELSYLAIFSLMISIITIASKASVVSFSNNPSVYRYNFTSIWADIFGFFAILTWVCQQDNQSTHLTSLFYFQLKVIVIWVITSLTCMLLCILMDFRDIIRNKANALGLIFGLNRDTVQIAWKHFYKTHLSPFLHKPVGAKILILLFMAFWAVILGAIPFIGSMIICIFPLSLISAPFIIHEVDKACNSYDSQNAVVISQANFILEGGPRISSCESRFVALSKDYNSPLKDLEDKRNTWKEMYNLLFKGKRNMPWNDTKTRLDYVWIFVGFHMLITTPLTTIFIVSCNFFMPVIPMFYSTNNLQISLSAIYLCLISAVMCMMPYAFLYRYYLWYLQRYQYYHLKGIAVARCRLGKMQEIGRTKNSLYGFGDEFPLQVLHIINSYLPTNLGDSDIPFVDFHNVMKPEQCGRFFLKTVRNFYGNRVELEMHKRSSEEAKSSSSSGHNGALIFAINEDFFIQRGSNFQFLWENEKGYRNRQPCNLMLRSSSAHGEGSVAVWPCDQMLRIIKQDCQGIFDFITNEITSTIPINPKPEKREDPKLD